MGIMERLEKKTSVFSEGHFDIARLTRKPYRLSVDPGLDFGIAIWIPNEKHPAAYLCCTTPNMACWWKRAEKVGLFIARLELELRRINAKPRNIGIEYPRMFSGSFGHSVAAKGDLGKLYYTCGIIAASSNCEPWLIPVNDWKGNLNKTIVIKRVKKRLGRLPECRSHAWDAVGIGLYMRGEF